MGEALFIAYPFEELSLEGRDVQIVGVVTERKLHQGYPF